MVSGPVQVDNPRASASGLSPLQAGKLRYNYLISADLAHCEMLPAKFGIFRQGLCKYLLYYILFTFGGMCRL